MKDLLVNVDGISESIKFQQEEDNWYSNEAYRLLINPELTYCISEEDSEFSTITVDQFRVVEDV